MTRSRRLRRGAATLLAAALLLSLGGCYVVPVYPGPGQGWHHHHDDDD